MKTGTWCSAILEVFPHFELMSALIIFAERSR